MARPKKAGLDYFPFDVDLFQDIKIRKLIKFQGGKAISVYALLLCLIYKNGYYIRWDEELPFIVSEQTGFEEAYIQEVIKSCMKLGLFNRQIFESHGVLTSKGIQERYFDICSKVKRKVEIEEFSCVSSEETPVSSEETPVSSEETPVSSVKSTQSKEKERKNVVNVNNACACMRTRKGDPDTEHQHIGEMKTNITWQEAVCMNFHISPSDLLTYIDQFALDMKCRGTTHDNIQDALRHFNDWLRIQLKSKQNGTSNSDTSQAQRLEGAAKIVQRILAEDDACGGKDEELPY